MKTNKETIATDKACGGDAEHSEIIIEETDKTDIGLYDGPHKTRAAFRNTPSNRSRAEVSILVFAYNNLQKHTKYCIESILKYTSNIDYELVLLDNGSSDGTFEYFKSVPHSKKKIVRITENKGANYGQYTATRYLTGRYIAMIANDVYVTANWLSNMIKCAESDERIGFLATVSDNVSNFQAVNLPFRNLEEMRSKAEHFNVSDPRKWEERLRLMPAIALYKRECLDIIGSLDYAFQHDFSDDDISFRVRRAGYKLVCCGDVFVHHSGSSAAGSSEKKMEVLRRGREIFNQKYFGIDAWEDINNFEQLMLSLVNPEEKRGTLKPEVLGIDVMCGTPVLQLKNKLRHADIFNTNLSAFVQDPKYWLDLKTICEGAVVVDRIEYLTEHFSQNSFDYILLGRPVNSYKEIENILSHMLSLLKIDGQLLIKFRNHFDMETFLTAMKNGLGSVNRTVSYSDINKLNMWLMQRGYIIQAAMQSLYDIDNSTKDVIRNALNCSNITRDIDAVLKELLTEEYALKITRNAVRTNESPADQPIAVHSDLTNVVISHTKESQTHTEIAMPKEDPLVYHLQRETVVRGMTSIIMVTNNRLDHMKKCIESIQKYTSEPHEMIFVESGTTDGTMKWVKGLVRENKNYRLIENAENISSAKCLNQGIKAARGEFIMLLNSDLVVSEGWLSRMLECLLSRQNTGIVGPVIVGEFYPQTTSEMHLLQDKYRYRRIAVKDVDGLCMLFRRGLGDEIGLLDEELASNKYVAEDYCLRARLEGYGNLIAGDVFVRSAGTLDTLIEVRGKNAYYEKWSGIDADSVLAKKLLAVKALGMADEFYQKGDTENAVQVLIEGMQYGPGDVRLYDVLVDMLTETKRFKEALDVIERMPVEADDARRLALIGYCKEGMDLMAEADEYADKSLVLNDSSDMAFNLKGIVAFKKGDRAAASDYFEKAKEADPGYGEPYTNLGVICWSEGNHTEGLDLLEKGFILSPLSGDLVDAYYSAISQAGAFDRMETTLRHTLSLFPSSRRIAFLLIDCLIRQGKDRDAMLEIEQSMITYGIDDGMLSAAMTVREKVGAKELGSSKKDETISLCMIVKNEESNLGKCLLNTDALVDEIIVVDTGSTDRTRDIAKAFGAKVYDFEWTHDFSEARNVSLSKAKGDWILVLDADEVISPRDFDALKKLVGRKKRENAYSVTTRNYVDCANVEGWTRNDGFYIMEEAGIGWLPSFKVRLFPNDTKIRFENPVHELVEPSLSKAGKKILKCKVPIHHYGKLNNEKCLVKGEAYYQLGRKKLNEQGDEVMPLLELALQASELAKYEEAVDLLQRLLKLDPNSAKAYFNLGYLYLKLGYYTEGIQSSKRALEIDPNIKEAILNLASCEVYGGDVNNAITALEDMLNKNPGHPPATTLLAMAYIIGGKVDEGIACIEKIKKMKADCPGVILNHAREFEKAGKIDSASLLLETAVRYGYVNSAILSMLEGLKTR